MSRPHPHRTRPVRSRQSVPAAIAATALLLALTAAAAGATAEPLRGSAQLLLRESSGSVRAVAAMLAAVRGLSRASSVALPPPTGWVPVLREQRGWNPSEAVAVPRRPVPRALLAIPPPTA